MYCSELVWKSFQRVVRMELGKIQTLREFDLSSKEVKRKMRERWGGNFPKDEPVISPATICDSDLLFTVRAY